MTTKNQALIDIENMLTQATKAPVSKTIEIVKPDWFDNPELFDRDKFIAETALAMEETGVIHNYDDKIVSMLANNISIYVSTMKQIDNLNGNYVVGSRLNPLLNFITNLVTKIEASMGKLNLLPEQRTDPDEEKNPAHRPARNKQAPPSITPIF